MRVRRRQQPTGSPVAGPRSTQPRKEPSIAQARPAENSPVAGASHGSVVDRLVGIDLARGLAV
ncbi:MAG: hypothetical protein E5X64_10260, partial [Mesorhizobium sp.]